MKQRKLADIMTKQLISLSTEDTVEKMALLFKESNIHHIPIVDHYKNLVGIVSKTDLDRLSHGTSLFKTQNINEHNEALYRSLRVVEIMTKDVIFLNPDDTIETAYRIFKKNRFRAIPIVENEHLVGIVCPLDLLDYAFAEMAEH